MITPEYKDRVLACIVDSPEKIGFGIYYDKLFPDEEISKSELKLILEQFVEMGLLLKIQHRADGIFTVFPKAKSHDFFNHGGFIAQEKYLKESLEKLEVELEILKKELDPSKLKMIQTITSIAGNIATALGLMALK